MVDGYLVALQFFSFFVKKNIELVQQKTISIFNSNYSNYTNKHFDQSNILYIIPILYLINDDISNDSDTSYDNDTSNDSDI